MYLWVDGIYSGLRSEEVKLCSLVVIGVNERGEKKFLTIEDGICDSTQSWREVLLILRVRWFFCRRSMKFILRPVTSAARCTRPRMC